MQTFSRDSVLKLYERLSSLIEKLPGGLQKPILRELDPIRELFLEQRPARILLVGGAEEISAPALLDLVCEGAVETGNAEAGWRTYRLPDRGGVKILDGRAATTDGIFEMALTAAKPDIVLFLRSESDPAAGEPEFVTVAASRVADCDTKGERKPALVGIAFGGDAAAFDGDAEPARTRLAGLLQARRELVQRNVTVFPAERARAGEIAEAICDGLPNEAKLEFARFSGARGAQRRIATVLLKSFTALCGVIGVQPIPLADLPILTTLQTLMVGMIVYLSGRRASARLIAEFAGAIGINFGVGLAFREGARALVKVLPVWGNAISGIVAGAGTYAIGRAAVAYFIDDIPLHETQKLFSRLQPGLESFRSRLLPARKNGKPE